MVERGACRRVQEKGPRSLGNDEPSPGGRSRRGWSRQGSSFPARPSFVTPRSQSQQQSMTRPLLAALAAISTQLAASPAQAQVQVLATPDSWSFFPSAMSADGTIVAGSADHPILAKNVGVWSEAAGMRFFEVTNPRTFFAYELSDDGQVLIGDEVNPQRRTGAVWDTTTGQRTDILPLPGDSDSSALFVSGDGRFVVGHSDGVTRRAFRWCRTFGIEELQIPGSSSARVSGVSRDGNVVVGSSVGASGLEQAFIWTPSGSGTQIPGLAGYTSVATDVSADGSVVVGRTNAPGFTSGIFYYGAGSSAVEVSVGATTPLGPPVRVSADGSTVIGTANFASGQSGFAWRPNLGHVILGPGFRATPLSVSADGTVIGGKARPQTGTSLETPFRWDSGAFTLLETTSEAGDGYDVSADGSAICGWSGVGSMGVQGLLWRSSGELGSSFCDAAVPNSTGAQGRLALNGTNVIDRGDLVLRATDLPAGATALFLVSRQSSAPLPVSGSQGLNCLGAPIGRFIAPGQVQAAGPGGTASLTVDLTDLPSAIAPLQRGVSLYFQSWYRDVNPGPTSNFTNGATVRAF